MSDRVLIMGLGNPGSKYAETRHNAGFWFLDRLLDKAGVSLRAQGKLQAEVTSATLFDRELILARPSTFMNHSGQAVRAVMDYYRIPVSRLMVAYDELDLPPGVTRLKQGGGHGGHNGVRDICKHLGDREFMRVRIGIGHPGHKDAVTRYVLNRCPAAERDIVARSIEDALDVLPLVLAGRMQEAMTRLHTQD